MLFRSLENVRYAVDVLGADKIVADFVVQIENYQEIPQFVALCNDLGIQRINWQKMWNWGTWPQAEFDAKNIYNNQHPDHAKLVTVFAQAGQRIQY